MRISGATARKSEQYVLRRAKGLVNQLLGNKEEDGRGEVMHSPFLWRHVGILLIVVANFACSAKVLVSQKGRSDFSSRPTVLGIALRAVSIFYAVASLLMLLIASLLFYSYEWSAEAREFWKHSRKWANVTVGMTSQEVVQILGPPWGSGKERAPRFIGKDTDDVYVYQMDLIQAEGGMIEFKIDSTSALHEMRVTDKFPDDERIATIMRHLAAWEPPAYTSAILSREIADLVFLISGGGLILLAIASMKPFSLRNGWNSWTLYTPLIALMLGMVYEMNSGGGWRFDLYYLLPVYALIIGCWFFRLGKAVSLSAQIRGSDHP